MAEAIAFLGVAAAALQFAEIGYKIISKCSSLAKENQEYPEYLQRTHNQIQYLMCLAKVAAENTGISEVLTCFEVQCPVSVHQHIQSPESRATISILLENIWKDCSYQAEIIDNILQNMIQGIEGRGIMGKWKKLRLHEKVYSIEKALNELERFKTTLGLWLGNESLRRMGRMHHDLAIMHNKFMYSERFLSRIFKEDYKASENAILATIQPEPAAKTLDAKTYDKQNRNDHHRPVSMVMPCSPNHERNLSNMNRLLTGGRGREFDDTNVYFPSSMKIEWSKSLTLAGNTIVLQLGNGSKKPFTLASKIDKHKFLCLYLRLRTNWLFDLVELKFSLQDFLGAPSVQCSLRTQVRVKCLPLHTFFFDIYGLHGFRPSRNKRSQQQRRGIPSSEEQIHMFSVARKLLLQRFYAGDASPDDINAKGQTLLHLQAELYHPGYETLFTKMTEFLISLEVDPDVLDDDLKTAQNMFCQGLLRYRRSGQNISHSFANGVRLSWASPLRGRSMSAFDILHCARDWPESIMDTGYEHIYDIVQRKSTSDLEKFRGQEDLESGDSISPLHFAAAASWPAGVETLTSMGYSKLRVDPNGKDALDIAIDVGCIPAVEILLRGDCLDIFALTRDHDSTLPRAFQKVAESDDSELHNIIIKCLLRYKFHPLRLFPYHDLARKHYIDNTKFAQKLFTAGFQDIDAYNDSGYTPLMVACRYGNIRMASFLLLHGANPHKCHEHVSLRAGHFLCYDGIHTRGTFWWSFALVKEDGFRSKDYEKQLVEAAFETSIIETRCRCSPDGFSPITSLFQMIGRESTFDLKVSFQRLLRNVESSPTNLKRYWRAFVVAETFNRLGMTHTCPKLYSEYRLIPEYERIGIEDDEIGLFFELEEIVARFDLFSENFEDDISKCVDKFFDDLDGDLRPRPPFAFGAMWTDTDPDCLGPGEFLFVKHFLSSQGQEVKHGYKEIIKEDSMLRLLFS